MNTQKYNGWTNYETWNAALWLDNDQGSQEFWSEQAQEHYDNAEADSTFTRKENASFSLREALKEGFEEQAGEVKSLKYGWMSDAIGAYISEVDWQEIAEHYLEEVEEEEVEEVQ